MTDNNPLSWYDRAQQHDWRSNTALILYLIAWLLLHTILVAALSQSFEIPTEYKLYSLLIPIFIYLIVWLVYDTYLIMRRSNKIRVLFAIKPEKVSRPIYKEVQKEIGRQITNFNLTDKLSIGYLSERRSFKDDKHAEKFIDKTGINLLVRGDTAEGVWSGEPITTFRLRFSYLYSVNRDDTQRQLNALIDKALAKEPWSIRHQHSTHGLIVVSSNIVETCLYILSLCLFTTMKVENIKAAIEILEALNELLKPKDPTNFPNLNKFKNLVISQLTECYHVLSLYYWWIDRNIELSKEAAEKALMLDPNRWGLHQNLSVISYLQGDRNAAEFHTLRAKRLNPQSDLPHLNEAFFAAADKKNQRLLQILKNRVRHVSDTIMTDVVSFIHDQYEKDADNYTLLFYLGWINTTFVDKSLGNEQLLEFVNQCKADTNYADLITEAKKLVSK